MSWTARDLMTAAVPMLPVASAAGAALATLRVRRLEEASHVYLVDEADRLCGQVPIEALLGAPPEVLLGGLRGDPPLTVGLETDAETIALLAVQRHDADVAVTDADGRLLGAIPIGRLLAVLHAEHVDDILRLGGVQPSHPQPGEPADALRALRARLPWLLLGLLGGIAAAGVVGAFELALQRQLALAFFLPLVVYMADAVGTQTETLLVRTLAHEPVALVPQLVREGAIGLLLGVVVGVLAALGLLAAGHEPRLALVLGLALVATCGEAAVVASLLPLALTRAGADPALASGPLATVVQDLLSVAIYLGIATAIL